MKFIPNKISVLLIGFLSVNFTFAAPEPPVPTPTPPPELSVDGAVLVLFFASLIFAFYKIHSIKKASR